LLLPFLYSLWNLSPEANNCTEIRDGFIQFCSLIFGTTSLHIMLDQSPYFGIVFFYESGDRFGCHAILHECHYHRFSFRKLRYLFGPCVFLNFQSAPCVHKNHISILCKITSCNYRGFRTTFLKILFIEICPSPHFYSNDSFPRITWPP